MKLEEILKKQGLNDEQITAITKSMASNKIYITSLENIDERYNKLKDQKKDLETQLGTANTTITDLKKYEKNNEELKGKIAAYETEKSNYEKMLSDKDFDYALDKALSSYKCKNSKIVKNLLERDKLKLDGESIIGLKDQMDSIKKENDFLFESVIGGTGSFKTGGSGSQGGQGSSGNDENFAERLGKAKASQMQGGGLNGFLNNK